MRRGVLLVVAGVLLALAATRIARVRRAAPRLAGPIDVIVISIDTLRADHVGVYGDAHASTPILDGLARRGTRFAHVVAPVPLTLPSHASLFTGVTPLAHGVHDNVGFALEASIPTLAERFKAAGYETGAFVSGAPLQRRFGLARGFDHYDDRLTRGGDAERPAPVERRADETVAAVGEWISEVAGPRQRSLFVWVHLFDPHAPYEPPDPFKARFSDRPYDGEVAFVDSQIGVLLDRLGRARPDRRALIAVTADHGEGLGDHGEPTHGLFVYDSTIRVPLMLEGPGVPSGRVVGSMVRLVDVAPTLLDLAGLAPLGAVDGASLAPTLMNEATTSAPAYVESRFGRLCCGWAPLHAWRDQQWMFVDAPRVELYDTAADPGQRRNVAAEHPADASRLQRALGQALAHESSSTRSPESPDTRAQLRSLGYVSGGGTARPSLRDPKDMIGVSTQIGRTLEIEDADPPRAARELAAVLREDPGNPLVRRHLGIALMRQRRFREAAGVLNALAADGDSSTETLTLLADLALERGDAKEARSRLETLYTRDPADTSAAFKLGVLSVGSGEMDRAVTLFTAVVTQEPANADALVDLAGALLKTHRAAEAATYFRRAIDAGATAPLAADGLKAALAEMQRR